MASRQQHGLGRGLGELFQRTDESEKPISKTTRTSVADDASMPMPDGSYFQELPTSQISANRQQPRQVFDEDELQELAESVREIGLLQPIVVRRQGPESYELIMGERRLRAHEMAGIERIPAIVRATDDENMLRDALLENLHRSQLNPLEEAAAYQQMMDDFGLTQEELSRRIKRSRPQISNTIRLLRLPTAVQRRVAAGVLSAGHARALLSVEDAQRQDELATRIVAEGLSVRAVEEIVAVEEQGHQTKRSARVVERRDDAAAMSLATTLSDRFDTRVKVTRNARGRGKIAIEFASDDDLERILALLPGPVSPDPTETPWYES